MHTWKVFFIHIATISVGLLIAIGLEQTAQFFHHRHQVAETRDALRVERRINTNRFAVVTGEFFRFVPKLQANLAIFQYLRQHPGAPQMQWPGRLDWLAMDPGFVDAAWKTAQQSTVLQYMARAEVKRDAELYSRLQALTGRLQAEFLALNEARRFAILDPDASHLSPAQIDRQSDLTSEVLLQYALAARMQNNFAAYYPDFTPLPTRDAVYQILHATTDPDDQKAISALNERMHRFEQEQGVDSPEPPSTDAAPDGAQK